MADGCNRLKMLVDLGILHLACISALKLPFHLVLPFFLQSSLVQRLCLWCYIFTCDNANLMSGRIAGPSSGGHHSVQSHL